MGNIYRITFNNKNTDPQAFSIFIKKLYYFSSKKSLHIS